MKNQGFDMRRADFEIFPEWMKKERHLVGWDVRVGLDDSEIEYVQKAFQTRRVGVGTEFFNFYHEEESKGIHFGYYVPVETDDWDEPLTDEELKEVEEIVDYLEKLETLKTMYVRKIRLARATINGLSDDLTEKSERVYELEQENEKLKAEIEVLRGDMK